MRYIPLPTVLCMRNHLNENDLQKTQVTAKVSAAKVEADPGAFARDVDLMDRAAGAFVYGLEVGPFTVHSPTDHQVLAVTNS
eukprot:scaffold106018_cov22-Prasinocladus_malaysianus.AAC.1